jgi:uncharacterized protein (TIGR03067 family)
MKALLGCTVVSLLFLAGGDADAIKKDLKLLEGTWKVESLEDAQGKKQEFEGATLTFKGDQFEFKKDSEAKKGKVKINPAGKPKEIDIIPEDKDQPLQGIYQIEGATLKICVNDEPMGARPNELAAKDKNMLVILKRVKE